MHLSQSFQINSKRRRAEASRPAVNGRYLMCKIMTLLFTFYCTEVVYILFFGHYINENFENAGESTFIPKRGMLGCYIYTRIFRFFFFVHTCINLKATIFIQSKVLTRENHKTFWYTLIKKVKSDIGTNRS